MRLIFRQGGVEKYRFDQLRVISDSDGVYSGTVSNISAGTYDILMKGDVYLQKKCSSITLNPGANSLDWPAMIAGDVNNDNIIRMEDVSEELSVWTSSETLVNSTNKKYDFNGDGWITISDITLIISNWTASEVYGDQ